MIAARLAERDERQASDTRAIFSVVSAIRSRAGRGRGNRPREKAPAGRVLTSGAKNADDDSTRYVQRVPASGSGGLRSRSRRGPSCSYAISTFSLRQSGRLQKRKAQSDAIENPYEPNALSSAMHGMFMISTNMGSSNNGCQCYPTAGVRRSCVSERFFNVPFFKEMYFR
jgi:hypothetical protein